MTVYNDQVNKLNETPSFKEFIQSNPKQIKEDEYIQLRNVCIEEAFGNYIPKSISDAYRHFNPLQQSFIRLLENNNIRIRWNSEFENRLKEYLKTQEPAPNTPFKKLDWYSQKRKEFEEIVNNELVESYDVNDIGC